MRGIVRVELEVHAYLYPSSSRPIPRRRWCYRPKNKMKVMTSDADGFFFLSALQVL